MPASLHKQSRRMSLIEAIANIAVGYSVAVAMQMLVFPLFGLEASLEENLALGALFTIASVCCGGSSKRCGCATGWGALGAPRLSYASVRLAVRLAALLCSATPS